MSTLVMGCAPRPAARAAALLGLVVSLLAAPPARASVHLTKIREFFPGTTAQPNAQYVMLQMYAPFQSFTTGSVLRVFNAANVEVGTFTFAADQANFADQATILIATTEAQALFAPVTANLLMTAAIPLAGGKICFDTPFDGIRDCVSWGNYAGPVGSGLTATGTPYMGTIGLTLGQAVRRDVSGGLSPTELEEADDTGDSAADFDCADAMPINNGGTSASLAADPACSPTPTTAPTSTSVPTTSTTSTTFPPDVGQRVSGKKLAVTRKGFSLLSKDPAISLGGGNGSADDPTLHGGSVRVVSVPGGIDTIIQLPPSRWRPIGRAGRGKGYKLKRNQALKLTIKPGKLVKVVGKGVADHPLAVSPDPVAAAVAIGGTRYCFAFPGGTFTPGKRYLAKDVAAPSVCP